MYLVLDKRTPRRYTWGFFVFYNGLKSSLTQGYSLVDSTPFSRFGYLCDG